MDWATELARLITAEDAQTENQKRETKNALYRFGVFEFEEASGELRKQGRRLRLQGQPCQVLLMLVARPGEIVSREEIRQRLWPDGTFVDFDHSLNTAINKLRESLGDSAANPRFVETIAKRGYRFLAPVQVIGPEASLRPPAQAPDSAEREVPAETLAPSPSTSANPVTGVLDRFLTPPDTMPQPPHAVVRTLFILIQLMYLCFYVIALARLGEVEVIVNAMVSHGWWVVMALIVSAVVGIPARLYLISAAAFRAPGSRENFLKLFPLLFPVDELWALAPFLLLRELGLGLALGVTAALVYLPFAQRSLILMGAGVKRS